MLKTAAGEVVGDQVTAGMLTRSELARQLGRSERTIIRLEKGGLPVFKRGTIILYEIERVRRWLRGEEPGRSRGRPRKVTGREAADART